MDRSNWVRRRLGRLRWSLVRKHYLPREVRLRACDTVRLATGAYETGSFVQWGKEAHGLVDNLLIYEPAETALFLERLNTARVIFDAGAHVGYYSLLAAAHPAVERVVAFEPLTSFAREVRFHARNNGFDQIQVVNDALGDGMSDIAFGNHAARVCVASITIDDFIHRTSLEPDFIKMDIEGAECVALRAASETLSRLQPELMLELHPDCIPQIGGSTAEVLEILASSYANVWRVLEAEPGHAKDAGYRLAAQDLAATPRSKITLWCSNNDTLPRPAQES